MLEVASSMIRIRGSAMRARAREMSCLWPMLSLLPRSLTSVSYPSDIFMMKSWAPTAFDTSITLSSEASMFPYFMLSLTVPAKRNGSWRTMAICFLYLSIFTSLRSYPSTVILPSWGS
ncbi:hypothetical protein ES703_53431 [subsurface metagenome]